MVGQRPIVIVDLEKDPLAVGVECAKVMLFVRVVGVTEVIVDGDRLNDLRYSVGPSAAMPGVMTAPPPKRCCRKSSLSARIRSVLLVMVVSLLSSD